MSETLKDHLMYSDIDSIRTGGNTFYSAVVSKWEATVAEKIIPVGWLFVFLWGHCK